MNSPSKTTRIFPRTLVLSLLSLAPIWACSGEPPVLTIGEVEYSETDLLGFSVDRRTRLAEITALGFAVSKGEGPQLGAPLVGRRKQISLLEVLEREIALGLAGVEEEALVARYETNPNHELSVRHLVILVEEWATEEEEDQARTTAQEALSRIHGGDDFAQVAGEVSQEPGAADRGGLLRPGRQETWVDEFWNAANSLEVGEVSSVIQTQYGFHVLKLENRTPLPFTDARYQVVEDVARLIPSQEEGIAAWTDSVSISLSVDATAVTQAWEEAGSLFILAQQTLSESDSAAPLARWDGGEFSKAQLRVFLLGLQRPSWEHVRDGGLDEVLRVTAEGARRALLEQVAGEMGWAIPESVQDAFQQEWDETVARWGAGFGFREGMTPDQVRVTALAAVASSAQGITIARQEIQGWAPLLLSAYPIGPE